MNVIKLLRAAGCTALLVGSAGPFVLAAPHFMADVETPAVHRAHTGRFNADYRVAHPFSVLDQRAVTGFRVSRPVGVLAPRGHHAPASRAGADQRRHPTTASTVHRTGRRS